MPAPDTPAKPTAEPWLAVLDRPVALDRLDIFEIVVPQTETFRSAVGVRRERRALFVRWQDPEGAWGVGECSCRPDPFFSGEFVDGAYDVLQSYIFPLLPRRGTIRDVVTALRRIRGWPFTCSAVLDALFDLGRRQGLPDPLDLWPGEAIPHVPVGISLGIFDAPQQAVDRVARSVEEGYRRVKMKIAPTMDPSPLAAVRDAFPDLVLGFDANGSCGSDDLPFLVSLAELRPHVLEQPFAPSRLDLCRDLRHLVPDLRICLDETLTDAGVLTAAHDLDALDEVNLKPGRVGGPLESLRILGLCRDLGLPAWVGGMFETGVGRRANLRYAARLPEAVAHDLSPSHRYFARDVVNEPIRMSADGTVDLRDDRPVELDDDAVADMTKRRCELVKTD
ncbi:MAG: enolase C-terminal domain-like protein [Acidobacteriota bacterium]